MNEPTRCPSVNPWLPEDGRCQLPEDHEGDHMGVWDDPAGARGAFWDTSPVSVSDDSPDRWETV